MEAIIWKSNRLLCVSITFWAECIVCTAHTHTYTHRHASTRAFFAISFELIHHHHHSLHNNNNTRTHIKWPSGKNRQAAEEWNFSVIFGLAKDTEKRKKGTHSINPNVYMKRECNAYVCMDYMLPFRSLYVFRYDSGIVTHCKFVPPSPHTLTTQHCTYAKTMDAATHVENMHVYKVRRKPSQCRTIAFGKVNTTVGFIISDYFYSQNFIWKLVDRNWNGHFGSIDGNVKNHFNNWQSTIWPTKSKNLPKTEIAIKTSAMTEF